jgi:NAD(P)-dependent dehydrogenase (short-subunit alcohol dehydrogenase family)
MRTYVLTGAAGGIGKATKSLLEERGHRVIGIDLKNADIEVDLATPEGRGSLHDSVKALAPDGIDVIIAGAGLHAAIPATPSVNYFGAVETLENLRPLLANSPAPRAATLVSFATFQEPDQTLVDRLLAGDEAGAHARVDEIAKSDSYNLVYRSTKRALARWMREAAPSQRWAGQGIPLNAVAPGVVDTPMVQAALNDPEARRQLLEVDAPMPLNGVEQPIVIARALAWITNEENTHMCGQITVVDGGSEVVKRGPNIFD